MTTRISNFQDLLATSSLSQEVNFHKYHELIQFKEQVLQKMEAFVFGKESDDADLEMEGAVATNDTFLIPSAKGTR
jgi:hypothetical protein